MKFLYLFLLCLFLTPVAFSQDTLLFKPVRETIEINGAYVFHGNSLIVRVEPYRRIEDRYFKREIVYANRHYTFNFIDLNRGIDLLLSDSVITKFNETKFEIQGRSFELVPVSDTHFELDSNGLVVIDCYLEKTGKEYAVKIFVNEVSPEVLEPLIVLALANIPYRMEHQPKENYNSNYYPGPKYFHPGVEPHNALKLESNRKNSFGVGFQVFPIGTSKKMGTDEENLDIALIASLEFEHFFNKHNSIGIRGVGFNYDFGDNTYKYREDAHGTGGGLGFSLRHFLSAKSYRGFFISPSVDFFVLKETYKEDVEDSWGHQIKNGERKSLMIFPNATLGYRVNLGDTFSVTGGLTLGYKTLVNEEETGTLKDLKDALFGVNLKLSWRFKTQVEPPK